MEDSFELCDTRAEGVIDFVSVQTILSGFEYEISRMEALRLVFKFSHFKNGDISYKEFLQLMESVHNDRLGNQEDQKRMLNHSFLLLCDRNKKQKSITLESLSTCVEANSEILQQYEISSKSVTDAFDQFDRNQDGKIHKQEFEYMISFHDTKPNIKSSPIAQNTSCNSLQN